MFKIDMEPIAIIGIGCRFPKAKNPEEFWQVLRNGIDTITEVPPDRWDVDAFYSPEPTTPGKMNTRWAGFIEEVDKFDASFFGISRREAERIDPQQRLVLEVAWEALENAGIAPDTLSGSQTGVYIGVGNFDYARYIAQDINGITAYDGTGGALSVASHRLSYALDLRGPSVTIDTACSSALVCAHFATQSLQNRETDLCLVGGVNLVLTPDGTIGYSQAQMMASDGRCKTFDASADGFVRGEGCGIIVLKRLSDALRDGDNVKALIRGSAVNQDGLSNGLTAPNGPSQQAVIRQALKNASVQPAEISYIEAHGTGTSLGDPIEMRSLKTVLMEGRQPNQPCWIGSVKTNVGHLEAAAGIVSIIKTVLALQHQEIPPHLHLKELNPYISLEGTPLSIPLKCQPWITQSKSRLAGISSFSFGGTNCHVILEEAPSPVSPASPTWQRPVHLLALSAKSEQALRELAQRYDEFFASHPDLLLADVCKNAMGGRTHFDYRLGVIASSNVEMQEQLRAFVAKEESPNLVSRLLSNRRKPKIAFLFTGQGSQYVNMGRQLYETQPTFRKTLEQCDEILRPYLEHPLLEVLYPNIANSSNLLDETAYTQPALFALEYSLYKLWESWGIEPSFVMGHSVGEYVAACVAGVFSLEDGLKLIAERGRLMQALPPNGAMVAVMAASEEVEQLIAPYGEKVQIAAINGPKSVVISGEQQAIDSVCQLLTESEVKTKRLTVSHAFHSPLMQPMVQAFKEVAKTVSYSKPQVQLVSNVTGNLDSDEVTDAEYWCNHVLQPVRFAESMQALALHKCQVLLEIGPKPTLLGMGRLCLTSEQTEKIAWLPSLRPDQSDWHQLLQTVGHLYVRGVSVDWKAFDAEYTSQQRLVLPTYPFQRERYWAEVKVSSYQSSPKQLVGSAIRQSLHPLVGQKLHLVGAKEIRFESYISQEAPVYLQDHRIYSMAIVPAAAYLEMALAAGAVVLKSSNLVLEDVDFQQVLMLTEDEGKTLQVLLTPQENLGYSFQIYSFTESEDNEEPLWTLHASGKVRKDETVLGPELMDLTALSSQYPAEISIVDHYQQFHAVGIEYGRNFQAITQLKKGIHEALGYIQLPEALQLEVTQYQLHPVLLDASFQVLGGIFSADERQDAYLPAGIKRLRASQRPSTHVWSVVKLIPENTSEQQLLSADLTLVDPQGSVIAQVERLTVRRVNPKVLQRILQKEDLSSWLYQATWKQKSLEPRESSVGSRQQSNWLIFAPSTGIGTKLAEKLREQGDSCVLVVAGSGYEQLSAEEYQVNPQVPEEFQRLLQDIDANGKPLGGVVHLWSLGLNNRVDAERRAGGIDTKSAKSLQEIQLLGCGSVLHLVQALYAEQVSELQHLWLVTQGALVVGGASQSVDVQQAPLWGLGKVIALEHPDLHCKCLDLDPVAEDTVGVLVEELTALDQEDQIAYREGLRYVPRLERYQSRSRDLQGEVEVGAEPFELKITEYGILDNLTLVPMARRQPGPGEVEIQVRSTGLNFRDVLNALGMLKEYSEQLGIKSSDDLPFGGECAGKIVAVGEGVTNLKVGDEVIAAHAIGSFSSFVVVKADFVTRKPERLNFDAAATIPVTFTTAHHALRGLANLKPGDRVLIHAAAGGVGQAAVQIALQVGAEVFATASPKKWDFLKSMGVEHVMNSRTLDFAAEIMAITNGQGVDVVLNSLNGDFIPKSFQVLASGGRFVEIGKIGIWDHQQVQAIRPDVSYFPFDMLDISMNEPKAIASMLTQLMEEFNQGKLDALPYKVFPIEEVSDAFRYMAQAKHIGKVVVSQPEITTSSRNLEQLVREDSSYLITGGLGALGLKVAQWLVQFGARHITLTGRRGASETASAAIQQMEMMGAKVLVAQADISQQEDVAQLLNKVEATMPPLRGIIHAAGVLDDGILLQQNWERFERVMSPKVEGTWHLHNLTQELPLDFFVCFSSVASLLGSPGQGNYAAANTFMDVLMQHRRTLGLTGLSINWGPWAEAGMAANLKNRERERLSAMGLGTISSNAGLQLLGEMLEQSSARVGVMSINWPKFIGQFGQGIIPPFLEVFASGVELPTAGKSEFLTALEAAPAEARHTLLSIHIRSQIAKVLGLSSPEQIEPRHRLFDLGIDSLMAVELKNWLEASLGCTLRSTLLFDYPTVEALINYLATEVLALQADSSVADDESIASETTSSIATSVEELSEEEAEALLLQELEKINT
jgi:acyl transferase domain-containing protein/acyl carrier protein